MNPVNNLHTVSIQVELAITAYILRVSNQNEEISNFDKWETCTTAVPHKNNNLVRELLLQLWNSSTLCICLLPVINYFIRLRVFPPNINWTEMPCKWEEWKPTFARTCNAASTAHNRKQNISCSFWRMQHGHVVLMGNLPNVVKGLF